MSELRDRIQRLDQIDSETAFRRAQGEARKLKRNLSAVGVTPPEAEPGFLSEALDFLGTPGQFVTGAIGNLTNTPGFRDIGIIDAGVRGTQENVTVGELLRRNDVLEDSPFTRAAVGLVGDIAVDPLSYITLGGGLGAKLGGKAVSANAIKTIGGKTEDALQIARRLEADDLIKKISSSLDISEDTFRSTIGITDSVPDDIFKAVENSEDLTATLFKQFGEGVNLTKEEVSKAVLRAQRDAAISSSLPFDNLASVLKQEKKFKAAIKSSGVGDDVAQAALDDLKTKRQHIADMMGVVDSKDLDQLFNKSGVRLSSPFAGIVRGGTAHSVDVPGVTKASGAVFDALGGSLYNAKVTVGELSDDILRTVEAGPGPVGFVGKMIRGTTKLPKLLSKRIQAGGDNAKRIIDEHDVAKIALARDSAHDVNLRFSRLDSLVDEADQDSFYRGFQNLFENEANKSFDFFKKTGLDDAAASAQAEKTALNTLRQTYNSQKPGLGDTVASVVQRSQDDLRKVAQKEKELGILDVAQNFYIRHQFDLNDANRGLLKDDSLVDDLIEPIIDRVKSKNPDLSFTQAREYRTLREAFEKKGLVSSNNYKEAYASRLIAHKQAVVEKEFIERMGLELGVSQNVLRKAEQLVDTNNKPAQEALFRFLDQVDVGSREARERAMKIAGADQLIKPGSKTAKALEEALEATPIKFRDRNGRFLSNELYNSLKGDVEAMALQGGKYQDNPAIFNAAKEYGGLKFTPEEQEVVRQVNNLFEKANAGFIGRRGESIYTRATANSVKKEFKNKILSAKDSPDDLKEWVSGVLPQSFVTAINDADKNLKIGKKISSELRKSGHTNVAEALDSFSGAVTGWTSALKYGVTQIWPSFHARNLASAQLLGIQEASAIGEQLNPLRMAESAMLRIGKGKIIQPNGRAISAKQLVEEARVLGFLNDDPLAVVDIMRTQAKALKAYPGLVKNEGVMRKAAKAGKQFFAGKIDDATGELVTSKASLAHWAQSVENFGREHLYFQLRRKGMDPRSAASQVNKVMVDYARGKTAFERDIMNNLIFFYSFARTTTANQIKSLVTRPGNLTAQLHAVNGVREMMIDPNAVPIPLEEQMDILSSRGAERIPRFIGRSDKGNPLFIEQVGVPIEDVSRFFNIRTPQDASLGAIMEAGIESFKATGQTIVSQLNPTLKAPLELIANKNFFFDAPLNAKFLNKVPKMADNIDQLPALFRFPAKAVPRNVWETLDDSFKSVLKGRENGDGTMQVNPLRLQMLELMVPGLSRLKTTVGALHNPDISDNAKVLRLFSGIKVQEVEPSKSRVFAELEKLRKQATEEGVLTNKQLARRRMIERSKGN